MSNRGCEKGRAAELAELAAAGKGIEIRDGGRVEKMMTNLQAGNKTSCFLIPTLSQCRSIERQGCVLSTLFNSPTAPDDSDTWPSASADVELRACR